MNNTTENTTTTEITIKPTISFTEYKTVCDSVVNACFRNGEYAPEYLDMMEQYYAILAYTDYDFGIEFINQENIDEIYSILHNEQMTEIYSEIMGKMQFCSLKNAINEAIDYRKNLIQKSSVYSDTDIALSSLCYKLEEFVDKISNTITPEKINTAMDVLQVISENKSEFSVKNIVDVIATIKEKSKTTKKPGQTK